jgi:hypothetical protein
VPIEADVQRLAFELRGLWDGAPLPGEQIEMVAPALCEVLDDADGDEVLELLRDQLAPYRDNKYIGALMAALAIHPAAPEGGVMNRFTDFAVHIAGGQGPVRDQRSVRTWADTGAEMVAAQLLAAHESTFLTGVEIQTDIFGPPEAVGIWVRAGRWDRAWSLVVRCEELGFDNILRFASAHDAAPADVEGPLEITGPLAPGRDITIDLECLDLFPPRFGINTRLEFPAIVRTGVSGRFAQIFVRHFV